MKSFILLCFCLIFMVGCENSVKKVNENSSKPNQLVGDTFFQKRINFQSLDTLLITADQYHIGKDKPVIILCHQAGYSRGEYKEIALTLNNLGFNCLAIDQRSGKKVNEIINNTHARAIFAEKPTEYIDAKQDITASILWAQSYYNKNVILWGSSYSASLSLIIAKENSAVEKVVSFSPGEYLSPIIVKSMINGLNKPVFLTSAKSEENQTKELFDAISYPGKVQFVPKGKGRHGSSALWTSEIDNEEYWEAVKSFLGV